MSTSYLSASLPFPEPVRAEEVKFWDHCKHKRLAFLTCDACGYVQHPPLPLCPQCQSTALSWKDAPERAKIYTYTVVHHSVHSTVDKSVPYIVAVVLFSALNDLRFVTNIVDATPDNIAIGMTVELLWEPAQKDLFLPRFKIVSAQ